ncbi:1001_t:CDS:1, partial [Ambispora gerdemannii]
EPIESQMKKNKHKKDNLEIDHELKIYRQVITSASQQVTVIKLSSALTKDTGLTSTLNVQDIAISTDSYEEMFQIGQFRTFDT